MAYYNLAEFVITDGTTYIDILNNFNLADWQPAVLNYREGGIFQESPLTDGRRLVQKYYSNLTDAFTLIVRAGRMDSAIADLRRMRQLMEKAAGYWDESYDSPVWIEARGTGETNRRYSIVMTWTQERDPNPYAMPFAGRFDSIGVVQFAIEHLGWTDKKPDDYTLTEISAVRSDSTGDLNYGNVDALNVREVVTNGGCFFSNSDANHAVTGYINQLGAVIWATNPTLFVANRQQSPSVWPAPVQLMPNTMNVGDGLFFATCGDGDPANSLGSVPFASLVFDIATAGSGYTIKWYYSADDGMGGDTWNQISVNDRTAAWTNTGVNAVAWDIPADWKPFTLFGEADNRYWIFAQVDTIASPVGPYQQNRNVYSVNWPFIEIQAGLIEGDIPAIMSFKTFTPTNARATVNAIDELMQSAPYRMLVGLYSPSFSYSGINSDDFTPYLGIVDGQVPYNTTSAAYNTGGTAGSQSFPDSPYQENLIFDTAVDGASVTITIEPENVSVLSTPATRYYGRFNAFLRYGQDGSPGATIDYFRVRLRCGGAITASYSTSTPDRAATDSIALPGVKNWSIAELGAIDTRGNMRRNETGIIFYLDIEASNDAVTANAKLYLFDLVLMPVEEWYADVAVDSSTQLGVLSVDGILYPRRGLRAAAYIPGAGFDEPDWTNFPIGVFQGNNTASASSLNVPILQKEAKQRLYFLAIGATSNNNDAPVSYPGTMTEIGLYHVQRYHSMRGNS